MYDEEAWNRMRSEAHEFMTNKTETLLKKWLEDIGYKRKEPIGYHLSYYHRTMEIYTTRPGPLIGVAGVNVERLKKMLTDEFYGEWNVKFVEIRGGFVNVKGE